MRTAMELASFKNEEGRNNNKAPSSSPNDANNEQHGLRFYDPASILDVSRELAFGYLILLTGGAVEYAPPPPRPSPPLHSGGELANIVAVAAPSSPGRRRRYYVRVVVVRPGERGIGIPRVLRHRRRERIARVLRPEGLRERPELHPHHRRPSRRAPVRILLLPRLLLLLRRRSRRDAAARAAAPGGEQGPDGEPRRDAEGGAGPASRGGI